MHAGGLENLKKALESVRALVCCIVLGVAANLTVGAEPTAKEATAALAAPCSITPAQVLKSGESVERNLGGGECHTQGIHLGKNEFLQIVVQQQGIDVVLAIYGEDGTRLAEVDRPNGSRGRETISAVAPVEGSYLLSIRSLENVSAQGKYNLTVSPVRPAIADDSKQIIAEQLISNGETLRSQGSVRSVRAAIEKFKDAAAAWHSRKDDYEEALAFYGVGISSTAVGDNQVGIEYLKRALAIFSELKNNSGEAMAKGAVGWPYMYLADTEKAFESFKESFDLYQSEGNIRGEGLTLYGIGWIHALRGENQEALKKFEQSLVRRQLAMDRRGEALTRTGIAKLEGRLGNYRRALENLNHAFDILPNPRDRYAEADILSNIGWAHSALLENAMALDSFNRALSLRQQVGDSIGEATTFYGLSIVHRRLEQFEKAEYEIEAALKIIESLRTRGSNQLLRMSYFASVQEYYEFHIALLMQLHRRQPTAGYDEKALHACERARARGLLDLLTEARVDLRQGVDSSILEQERSLIEKLNAAVGRQRHLLNGNNQTELESTNKEVRELNSELEAVRSHIRAINPRYAALTQPQPLTAREIQSQVLDRGSLLLQYALGDERSYLLAVSPEKITTYEIQPRREIEQLARRFYDASTIRNHLDPTLGVEAKRAKLAEADAEATQLAQTLSTVLLAPAASRLKNHRLIIVAPGALQLVPFAALPRPLEASPLATVPHRARLSKADQPAPLVVNHEIVGLPSMTTLSLIRHETISRTRLSKTVIVLGDPVFDSNDGRLKVRPELSTEPQRAEVSTLPGRLPSKRAIQEVNTEFPRLISSRWEGRNIVSLAHGDQGKLVLDFAASREMAVSPELGRYRFVHFATHAVIDDQHPESSGIVFSMIDQNGRALDGFLRLHEIYNLKLPVELVVLSACRTALGKDYEGEGYVGLTRGFIYAGAERVVVSLWQVADQPTSELMVRFYRHLLGPKKPTPAAALRAAQLELWKDPRWHSPYFWAPFVIEGEWN